MKAFKSDSGKLETIGWVTTDEGPLFYLEGEEKELPGNRGEVVDYVYRVPQNIAQELIGTEG